MNIHHYEYLSGADRNKKDFEYIIQDDETNVRTNAHWSFGNGKAGHLYIGDVEITAIIKLFHENREDVMEKLMDVFHRYFVK